MFKTVTVKDIAKHSGVSVATVSYVLNNRSVSEEKKAKVLRAIEELDYVPNNAARKLRIQKNNTIAMILPDLMNPFYPDLAKGCQDIARDNGYTLLLYNTEDKEYGFSELLDHIKREGVDGIILANALEKDIGDINKLMDTPYPLVLAHRGIKDLNIDSITADNYIGSYSATKHLISLGHENIAFIKGSNDSKVSVDRKKGFLQAMKDEKKRVNENWLVEGDTDYQKSYIEAKSLLASVNNRPTAIFASSDIMAFGVIDAATDLNLSVPSDLAVIGFDDLFISSFRFIQLTTVHVPRYELGKKAMEHLIHKIRQKEDNEAQNIVLGAELIIRNTCGAYNKEG